MSKAIESQGSMHFQTSSLRGMHALTLWMGLFMCQTVLRPAPCHSSAICMSYKQKWHCICICCNEQVRTPWPTQQSIIATSSFILGHQIDCLQSVMYTVLIEHVCVCICNPDAGNFIPSRPSFDGTLVPVHTQSLPGRKKMGFLGFLILLLLHT